MSHHLEKKGKSKEEKTSPSEIVPAPSNDEAFSDLIAKNLEREIRDNHIKRVGEEADENIRTVSRIPKLEAGQIGTTAKSEPRDPKLPKKGAGIKKSDSTSIVEKQLEQLEKRRAKLRKKAGGGNKNDNTKTGAREQIPTPPANEPNTPNEEDYAKIDREHAQELHELLLYVDAHRDLLIEKAEQEEAKKNPNKGKIRELKRKIAIVEHRIEAMDRARRAFLSTDEEDNLTAEEWEEAREIKNMVLKKIKEDKENEEKEIEKNQPDPNISPEKDPAPQPTKANAKIVDPATVNPPAQTKPADKKAKTQSAFSTPAPKVAKEKIIETPRPLKTQYEKALERDERMARGEIKKSPYEAPVTVNKNTFSKENDTELLSERIANTQNFDELLSVIESIDGIQGSQNWFSKYSLIGRINLVRAREITTDYIPTLGGINLKAKVEKFLKDEGALIYKPVGFSQVKETPVKKEAAEAPEETLTEETPLEEEDPKTIVPTEEIVLEEAHEPANEPNEGPEALPEELPKLAQEKTEEPKELPEIFLPTTDDNRYVWQPKSDKPAEPELDLSLPKSEEGVAPAMSEEVPDFVTTPKENGVPKKEEAEVVEEKIEEAVVAEDVSSSVENPEASEGEKEKALRSEVESIFGDEIMRAEDLVAGSRVVYGKQIKIKTQHDISQTKIGKLRMLLSFASFSKKPAQNEAEYEKTKKQYEWNVKVLSECLNNKELNDKAVKEASELGDRGLEIIQEVKLKLQEKVLKKILLEEHDMITDLTGEGLPEKDKGLVNKILKLRKLKGPSGGEIMRGLLDAINVVKKENVE